jgi:hypothetical protein
MAKDRFLVSRTYAETTPESVEAGDFSDTGWVFKDFPMTLRDVVEELRGCFALSDGPTIRKNISGRTWASTLWDIKDYGTGTEREESVHIRDMEGEILPARTIYRIYKLAGLVK